MLCQIPMSHISVMGGGEGAWSIRYENASGSIAKNVPLRRPAVDEELLVTSQEHIFVLAFTYRSSTDDFLVRFQWTNTDRA